MINGHKSYESLCQSTASSTVHNVIDVYPLWAIASACGHGKVQAQSMHKFCPCTVFVVACCYDHMVPVRSSRLISITHKIVIWYVRAETEWGQTTIGAAHNWFRNTSQAYVQFFFAAYCVHVPSTICDTVALPCYCVLCKPSCLVGAFMCY